ncbi:MAG: sugar ABC transporter ATP-binding protein [Planctomycetaceae bacterium]
MIDSTRDIPLLSMRGIDKSFPGVQALRQVDLDLARGEVLALLGENGAGKSTLIKVLGGAHRPDAGSIEIEGAPAQIASPADANRAGIAVIYQEFNLVPTLSARANIFLGQEQTTATFVRRREERRAANELFQRLGVPVDPEMLCRDLTIAQQQIVEIAKALWLDARILVMDEPSATLTPRELDRLFDVIRELQAAGIGVIYISHRLDEIFNIANRVTILRDGEHVRTSHIDEFTRDQLIEAMVGRKLENEFPTRDAQRGEARLVVRELTRRQVVRDVSLSVHRGEILGMTGLVGAGRTETARLIFGADRRDSGLIELDGRTLRIRNPRDAIRAGICLLTEDRKSQGLLLRQSSRHNFGLPNLADFSSTGFLRQAAERALFADYIDKLHIKIPHQDQPAGFLSGGNQQKVVLAKWLARNCKVLIFDEPTRGIDVGAKFEFYVLMHELAAQGMAIIMISSELPEILGMSDRILVMHAGRITGEITDVRHSTQEQIMQLAVPR